MPPRRRSATAAAGAAATGTPTDVLIARMRRELPMHDPVIAESVERIEQRLAVIHPRTVDARQHVWHQVLSLILVQLPPPEHCAAALACKLWAKAVRELWTQSTHLTFGGDWFHRVTSWPMAVRRRMDTGVYPTEAERADWNAIRAAANAGLASKLRTAKALRVLDLRPTRCPTRIGFGDLHDDDASLSSRIYANFGLLGKLCAGAPNLEVLELKGWVWEYGKSPIQICWLELFEALARLKRLRHASVGERAQVNFCSREDMESGAYAGDPRNLQHVEQFVSSQTMCDLDYRLPTLLALLDYRRATGGAWATWVAQGSLTHLEVDSFSGDHVDIFLGCCVQGGGLRNLQTLLFPSNMGFANERPRDMDGVNADKARALQLCSALADLPGLRRLRMSSGYLGAEAVVKLLVGRKATLECLDIAESGVHATPQLADALASCAKLRRLNLSGTCTSERDWQAPGGYKRTDYSRLFSSLPASLEVLVLGGHTDLTTGDMHSLAVHLGDALRTLHLYDITEDKLYDDDRRRGTPEPKVKGAMVEWFAADGPLAQMRALRMMTFNYKCERNRGADLVKAAEVLASSRQNLCIEPTPRRRVDIFADELIMG